MDHAATRHSQPKSNLRIRVGTPILKVNENPRPRRRSVYRCWLQQASGFDFPDDGRALIATDWDGDGDLDIFVSNRNAPRVRFLRNNSPPGNRHLAIRLQSGEWGQMT